MKMQLIQAPNMKMAMVRIQELFGPDAMIYQTRRGLAGVEVVAGVPSEEGEHNAVTNSFSSDEILSESDQFKHILEGKLNDLTKRMQEISDRMESMGKSPKKEPEFRSGCHDAYYSYLRQLGFSEEMIRTLFSSFIKRQKSSEDVPLKISRRISQLLDLSKEELIKLKGVAAIVGPTGAGKTTSIIKMANRFLQEKSAGKIGIISTDVESFYLKSKLHHYCEIYDIDFQFAASPDELNVALLKMKDKDLVLIDTQGVCQRNKFSVASLRSMFDKCAEDIDIYLALPCSLQESVMYDVVEKFSFGRFSGCILTKADECSSIVSALSVTMKYDLTISYICNGQDLERDIQFPTKSNLMNFLRVVVDDNQNQNDYRTSSFNFLNLINAVGARIY